jgi:plasmid stabilization system protein ParE
MSLPVTFRHIARTELVEAVDWYETRKAGLGAEFILALDHLLNRIASSPLQFRRVRGNIRRALMRRFPFAVYFIYSADAVIILAVFHCSRDPQYLENRS